MDETIPKIIFWLSTAAIVAIIVFAESTRVRNGYGDLGFILMFFVIPLIPMAAFTGVTYLGSRLGNKEEQGVKRSVRPEDLGHTTRYKKTISSDGAEQGLIDKAKTRFGFFEYLALAITSVFILILL